jgi:hypothetical protein
MKAPVITLTNAFNRENPVVHLSFEKDFTLIGQQVSGYESSKTTEIYPVGIYYISWKSSINTEFSNGVNTHIANTALAKIKSPPDRFFADNVNDTNMLQK